MSDCNCKDSAKAEYNVFLLIRDILSSCLYIFMVFTWLCGFVLAKGFWSTLCAIIPFWSWYLLIENLALKTGWLP